MKTIERRLKRLEISMPRPGGNAALSDFATNEAEAERHHRLMVTCYIDKATSKERIEFEQLDAELRRRMADAGKTERFIDVSHVSDFEQRMRSVYLAMWEGWKWGYS